MQTIVDAILTKDKRIQRATSAYIDDVYVDKSIVPAAHVKEHLCSFSLLSKELERLQDGLQVWGEDNSLYWRRGNKIPDMPRDGTYFHYAANWLGTVPWVVGFV